MPMQETFWGDYFGQLCDRFGIQWMISWAMPRENQ
jgi:PhnB protein